MIPAETYTRISFGPTQGNSPGEFWGHSLVVAQASPASESHGANEAHAEAGGEKAGEAHHAEGSEGYRMPAEFPNIATLIQAYGHDEAEEEESHGFFWANPHWYISPIFSICYSVIFLLVIIKMMGKRSIENPSKPQVAIEALFSGLMSFFGEIIGPKHARQYVPYVGTLWLFILVNKLAGLIPGLVTPWSHAEAVAALGLCTFLWVNFNAIKTGGLGHYIWHLCGSPTNAIGWGMVIIMLPLEIIGTLIKPVSLTLRLYGNTFGEDKLLASFLGLGMTLAALFMGPTPIVGVPLHFPFMFLGILASVIQSTVFAMLAAVYIAMLLPHEDHHHEHEGHHVTEEEDKEEGFEVNPVA